MPEADTPAQVAVEEPTTPAQVAPVVTEEPFDKDRAMATIQKLRETEKQAKKDAAELAAFKADAQKKADAELTEAQRLAKQLEDERKENRLTRAENAALLAGLPKEFASRLQGDTKEALEADALEFSKLFPEKVMTQKIAPKINTTNPQNPQQSETQEQMKARLFGGQGMSIFDPKAVRDHGGGVFG